MRLALFALALAVVAGVLLFILDPQPGSNLESLLGITAAMSGAAAGLLAAGAVGYTYFNRLWPSISMATRLVLAAFIFILVALTLVSLGSSVIGSGAG